MEKVASNHVQPSRQRSSHYGVAALPYTITQRVVFIVFGGASIGFASHKTTAHKSRKYQIST